MSFRDPVCGMVLNEDTAKFKITYEGETSISAASLVKRNLKDMPQNS